MSQLYDLGYNPALDPNGEPYPGALLHTYVPGTTTNKATYTSDALSSQNPNPLVADSAGRFDQMFAAEGEVFDLVLTDADGGNSRSFYNITSLGGTEGVLEKNFGVNGRFQVYGEAGVVNIETGPPTGDDVGGEGRIGGWDGSQGDALEIDYAATTVTGNLVVNGTISDVEQVLSSGSVSTASSLPIALPAGFTAYRIELRYVGFSASASLYAYLAFDSVPTYKSASGDYTYGFFAYGGGSFALEGSTASVGSGGSSIIMSTATGGAVSASLGSGAELVLVSAAGKETTLTGHYNVYTSSGYPYAYNVFGGTANKNYGKATYIKFQPNSGTITAEYTLYGVPTS